MTNPSYKEYFSDWFGHPLSPVDDNLCTIDSCEKCTGIAHAALSGGCRGPTTCGTCEKSKCSAVEPPPFFDVNFKKIEFTTLFPLPNGDLFAFVQASEKYDLPAESGAVRFAATAQAVAANWTKAWIGASHDRLNSGQLVGVVSTSTGKTVLAFNPETAAATAYPFSGNFESWPVIHPDDSVEVDIENLVDARHKGVNLLVAQLSEIDKYPYGYTISTSINSTKLADLPGHPTGTTKIFGVGYAGSTPLAWGLADGDLETLAKAAKGVGISPAANPHAVVLWFSADETTIQKITTFNELPTLRYTGYEQVHGSILPTGGVAVQVGNLIAWTDADGNKIGLAELPSAQAGMHLFGVWPDGSVGLVDGWQHRIARIPWDWSAKNCP